MNRDRVIGWSDDLVIWKSGHQEIGVSGIDESLPRAGTSINK